MNGNAYDGMALVNTEHIEPYTNELVEDFCKAVHSRQSSNSLNGAQMSVELKTMMQQVNKHVTPLLLIILKLLSSHKSVDVRKTGVDYLCRSLLVITEKAWEKAPKEKVGDIQVGALECLLSLQENENGKNLLYW